MGFMDKVRSTSDEVVSALSDAVNDVSNKGKEMTAKAKINKNIRDEEKKINDFFMNIGKKFFEQNETAPSGYEEQFVGIKNARSEIEKLRNELESIEPVCPKCGRKVTAEQSFCQSCGTNLNE